MPKSWKELTNELKELQGKFIGIAENLEKSKRNKPGVCGSWSPKEVVAHLSGWDKEVIRQFDLFLDGLDEAIEHDINEFNKQSVRERRHLSWDKTVEELKGVHERFYKKTKSIPPQEISKNDEYRDWMEVQIEHYIHHINQVKEWV
jgi:flagellar biosynthesis chaperone FliJ